MLEKRANPAELSKKEYRHIYLFRLAHAMASQIMVGAPIVIYAKMLGASSFIIGLLTGLAASMAIAGPLTAKLVHYWGYRTSVVFSVGIYTVFIFCVSALSIAPLNDHPTKLLLLGGCICLFNFFRYSTHASYNPWVTNIIPTFKLGAFVSKAQFSKEIGYFCALILSSFVASEGLTDQIGIAFTFSIGGLAGIACLYFASRIPDVHTIEIIQRSAQSISLRTILANRPFIALLVMNLAFVSVVGTLNVFTVDYLREKPLFPIKTVLYLSALPFAGAFVIVPFLGSIVNSVGAKLVIRFSIFAACLISLTWFLVASDLLPSRTGLIAFLMFLAGLAESSFVMACRCLLMTMAPEIGRNHFLAFYSVVITIELSIVLLFWGALLDSFSFLQFRLGAIHFHRHSWYFLGLFLSAITSLILLQRLKQDKEIPTVNK